LKNKFRSLTLLALAFTVLLSITPIVSAKTRNSYLTDFIFSTQDTSGNFGSTVEEMAFSLEIINYYDLFSGQGLGSTEIKVDITEFQNNIKENITTSFNNDRVDIYNLYYYLESLKTLGVFEETIDSVLHNRIYTYLNQTRVDEGGFAPTNTSSSANMVSTFFVYSIFKLIDEDEDIVNQSALKSWILMCNNTDGGYGGNNTLQSNLLTTCYAVFLLNDLGTVDDLDNQTATLNYLKSLYINNIADSMNYGGYLPDTAAENVLLSSSYYCITAISLIDNTQLNPEDTIALVLSRQNFQDGGFIEYNNDLGQDLSSITTSYYAFKILLFFDALYLLNENIFMVEFNFVVLLIVLVLIGIVIGILFFIWRKRRI